MYLFDTDTLSNLLTKRPSARMLERLREIPAYAQFTSSITVGEIYYGLHKSDRPDYYRERLERLVWCYVHIVPFDRMVAETYGELRAELERKGECLSDPDLMIAAIALSRSFVVVTGNTRHFSRIRKLKVENWL